MPDTSPSLHIFCGKIAAGKSTPATRLGRSPGTPLIADDDWPSTPFSGDLHSLPDHLLCSSRLWRIMAPHVAAYPLHLRQAPEAVCLARPRPQQQGRPPFREDGDPVAPMSQSLRRADA